MRKALSDFRYFMSNYAQIVGKDRRLHPFELNPFQEMLFQQLLPLVKKETRLDKRLSICLLKPRQVGCTTGIIAFINYICAFLDDFTDTSVCHVLPVADTTSKLYTKKIEPIISGIHPDLYPTIERETLGSSIMTRYKDIKGVRRQNFYEVLSAGASSVRSDTINISIFDECAFYRRPEVVSDAVLGSMPDYGFSLVIYMSTFEDRNNDFFMDKILTAREGYDDWKMVFCPWFVLYPERPQGIKLEDLELTEYDEKVIIPEMIKYGISKTRWGDAIDWYHRKSRVIGNVKKEFPTTIEEIIEMGQDNTFWPKEMLDKHEDTILPGHPYRILTDNRTGRPEAQQTDDSPFIIYRLPIYGHQYRIAIDPITARSEDTDNFVMHVFDTSNNEQVATFADKGLTDEDYADWAVSIGTIYNNAQLCPEINVANGFVVAVNARRYYHWWYQNKAARANHAPGLRTTVTSKEAMLDAFTTMLDRKSVIIHDANTLDECRTMVKHVKHRADGTRSVSVAAKKGKHDDRVAAAWIYAGTLDVSQLSGNTSNDWFIV